MIETAREIAIELLSGESALGFHWQTRAWYHHAENQKPDWVDGLSLGVYHNGGGTSGEWTIEWTRLQPNSIAARMKAFDDCWHILPLVPDLFDYMAAVSSSSDSNAVPTEDFTKRLMEMGWRDLTARVQDGGDGFDRRSLHGAIPPHMLSLFPGFTHFASVRGMDDEWPDQLKGEHELINDELLMLTCGEDAVLTHLRYG